MCGTTGEVAHTCSNVFKVPRRSEMCSPLCSNGSVFELDDVGAEFDTGRLLEYSLVKE